MVVSGDMIICPACNGFGKKEGSAGKWVPCPCCGGVGARPNPNPIPSDSKVVSLPPLKTRVSEMNMPTIRSLVEAFHMLTISSASVPEIFNASFKNHNVDIEMDRNCNIHKTFNKPVETPC